jgi:hypothetical protein
MFSQVLRGNGASWCLRRAHAPIRLQEGSDSQRRILSKSWEKVTSPKVTSPKDPLNSAFLTTGDVRCTAPAPFSASALGL